MKTSLVTYTYNDQKYLEALLASVPAWGIPFHEIIVVDDCSTEAFTPNGTMDIQIIRNAVNKGPAEAKRIGLGAASGDVLLSIDCDMRPHRKWLQKALPYLSDPAVGLVGTHRIVSAKGDSLASKWNYLYSSRCTPTEDSRVTFLRGGIFLMRKTTYEALGGISSHLCDIGEDIRLSMEAARKNFIVVNAAQYPVYQMRTLTIPQQCKQSIVYMGKVYSDLARDKGTSRFIKIRLEKLLSHFKLIESANQDIIIAVTPVYEFLCMLLFVREKIQKQDRHEMDVMLSSMFHILSQSATLHQHFIETASSIGLDCSNLPPLQQNHNDSAVLPDAVSNTFRRLLDRVKEDPVALYEEREFHYLDSKPVDYGSDIM